MKPVVKFTKVSKRYSLFKKKSDQLLDMFSFKKNKKNFSALSDVSFEVFRGETIGIVGTNGSGKSTLSNLLAQVIPPSSGIIEMHGEPTLVAISAGLNNHLTGYENIELKCLMHGMNKKEIEAITPAIIDFADIGDFMDQPIKNYSSGMKSRLGFAISVHIDPDILIIDEALSVGDSTFHQKCVDKFAEFKQQGKTIFFISHSLNQVKSISDRMIWMNHGQIEMFDETEKVAKEYNSFIKWFNQLTKEEKKEYKQSKLRSQMNKSTIETDPIKRLEKRKKRTSFSSVFQIVLFSLFVIISTLLLFIDQPVEAVKDQFGFLNSKEAASETAEEDKNTAEGQGPVEMKEIDQPGAINTESSKVYNEPELTSVQGEIPITTKVDVENQIGDVYEVTYEGQKGYVKASNIQLSPGESEISTITLDELAQAFPGSFAQSYEYFFAFIDSDYESVKSTFNGLTDETEDESGRSVLLYETDGVAFKFDEDNNTDELEVMNIDVHDEAIEELKEKAYLSSNDDTIHYIENENFQVILNAEEETLQFKTKKEKQE
ncbi:ABC transporter ATP-binding protein [Halobacillus mangrovi]|uniref:ABC transporter ATP-binding protein n=1 Tax=Halobacillus mangrovi TaxID=402384 RepID=UPI003D9733D2